MADSSEPVAQAPEDDDVEVTPGYQPPALKSLDEIQNLDADDESLVRYKQQLLGGGDSGVLDEGGSNVLVKQLIFVPVEEGIPQTEMDLTGDLAALKAKTFTIKEGCEYRLKVTFRVQREIVAGLRYFQTTHRKGIRVDKNAFMVGSYGPKTEQQEYLTPVDEAPKGMISRGHYTVKSKFTDDDKNSILEWDWAFDIKKDWD